jgi:hypothetical protein
LQGNKVMPIIRATKLLGRREPHLLQLLKAVLKARAARPQPRRARRVPRRKHPPLKAKSPNKKRSSIKILKLSHHRKQKSLPRNLLLPKLQPLRIKITMVKLRSMKRNPMNNPRKPRSNRKSNKRNPRCKRKNRDQARIKKPKAKVTTKMRKNRSKTTTTKERNQRPMMSWKKRAALLNEQVKSRAFRRGNGN